MSKVKYYQCLGCFTVYDHRPKTCCGKYHSEPDNSESYKPYAIDRVSEKKYAEYVEAVREGWL